MGVVNIAVIGLGTVGGGLVRLLQRHHDDYLASYGVDLRLKRACARSARHAEELELPEGVFTTDWREAVFDPEVDIVVELIGGALSRPPNTALTASVSALSPSGVDVPCALI